MKNIIATIMMVAVLMVGTSFAKDGLLVSDFNAPADQGCTAANGTGIIIGGLANTNSCQEGDKVSSITGIIIGGLTGIIIGG